MEAELVHLTESDCELRVKRLIVPGSNVQILVSGQVIFGRVWLSTETGGQLFEVDVAVDPPSK